MSWRQRGATARLRIGHLPVAAAVVAIVVAGFAATPSAALAPTSVSSVSSDGCRKVVLYFSRGSGERIDTQYGLGKPGLALYYALIKRYERSNVAQIANGYPAVNANPLRRRRYLASVANGVQSAKRNIAELVRLCPHAWLVLGGYSQGAQVTRGALANLNEQEQQHIAAVVFFGDPYFVHDENNVTTLPGFNRDQRGIAFQLPLPKVIPISASYRGKVLSWCHARDRICQGIHRKNGFTEHKNYTRDAEAAAREVVDRLTAVGVPLNTGSGVAPGFYTYDVTGTCGTGACGLAEWSGPGTESFDPIGAAYEGQQLDIACQVTGQTITGANGRTSAIWDELSNHAFVSDYYVDTPNIGKYSRRIPRCPALDVVAR
jgi:hypothetical protein